MRQITRIHQCEITTRCNLSCKFCPHPTMPRTKEDITPELFSRAMKWCQYYLDTGDNQTALSLTGIGESLLHPNFIDFCSEARATLPDAFIHLSTNGLLVTEEICKALRPLDVKLDISLHRMEKAGPAIVLARKYGIFHDPNPGPSLAAFDWAGQVDWKVTAPVHVCQYLDKGWGCILADGRITTCCMDADGSGVVGHINDPIGPVYLKPYKLCDTCHLQRPEDMRA